MIKHLSFCVSLLFCFGLTAPNCFPNCLMAATENPESESNEMTTKSLNPQRLNQEDIPLPPSLRENKKKEVVKEDHFVKEFVNMLMTLGGIITLLLLATYLLKKAANTRVLQMNESSQIKVLERRSLNPKTTIYLLDVNGKEFTLVESVSGLLLLPDAEKN